MADKTPDWAQNLIEPHFKIKLKNYQLRRNDGKYFIGRSEERHKLLDILKSNWNKGGAYLVAGYRGVGKTEFVRTTLDKYENNIKHDNKAKKILRVNISLGNEKRLDSMLVLNDVVSLMLEEFKEKHKNIFKLYTWLKTILLLAITISLLSALELIQNFDQPLSTAINLFTFQSYSLDETIIKNIFLGSLLLSTLIILKWRSSNSIKIYRLLARLLTNMTHSSENSQSASFSGFSFLSKHSRQALNSNEIELELKNILTLATKKRWHVIFIFDELDKLTNRSGDLFEQDETQDQIERRNRKRQVDNLLGELKTLISTTQATYIFISGRDMYDAYLSELGSPNSLYESLFKDHIYIPSLMTDHSDGNLYLLDSMIEHVVVSQILPKPDDDEKIEHDTIYLSLSDLSDYWPESPDRDNFFTVKTFVHFLAVHSWGNCKRLLTIFDSFVVKENDGYVLEFHTKDIQRLILASHLYILFHHHLARVFINADDKLVVSSFAVFHYIMKFHDMGFSRSHINRMYQTLNVHSSPELVKVVEIIIHKVLNNHIRRVRNSYYRYRFSSLYEQEIHYITTISEKESAAFSFSLDAMESIKRTYRKMLEDKCCEKSSTSKRAIADLHIILGNFHFWEQSFDEASIEYQCAISILENENLSENLDVLMALVEAYLKRASVEERAGNHPLSAAIYSKAIDQVERHYKKPELLHSKDSKMDIFKQPYWALKFLHLKRSAVHYNDDNNDSNIESIASWKMNDQTDCCNFEKNVHNTDEEQNPLDVQHYREAVIKLYIGQPGLAYKCFMNVARLLKMLDAYDERTCYLGGKAILRASYSLLAAQAKDAHSKMKSRVSAFQLNKSFGARKEETDLNSIQKPSSNQEHRVKEMLSGLFPSHKLSDSEDKDISQQHSASTKESKYEKRMLELIEMLNEYIPYMHSTLLSVSQHRSLETFRKCVLKYNDNVLDFNTVENPENPGQGSIFCYAIGLMSISATAFERARLNANSAAAYLSIVMMWTTLMEMLPWRLLSENKASYGDFLSDDAKKKLNEFEDSISKLRSEIKAHTTEASLEWVAEAENFAFVRNSYSTAKAMSHSAKVLLRRCFNKDENIFSQCGTVRDMVDHEKFCNNYLFQHYSMFGQMTLSAIKWENFSTRRLLDGKEEQTSDSFKTLPFSVRYYSTMLWLQGRYHLNRIMEGGINSADDTQDNGNSDNNANPTTYVLDEDLKQEAIKALVKFYRASQYVIKTAGDSSNAILPPIFMIYYNMWEAVYFLVESYCDKCPDCTYEHAVSEVVSELDKVLEQSNVKDVSSRIFDLSNLSVYALDHFSVALKMDDANSREATSTLRSKYYLDDDFEDDIFTLDWSYTQIFAPGAYIHSQVIKTEMARLKEKFKNKPTDLNSNIESENNPPEACAEH